MENSYAVAGIPAAELEFYEDARNWTSTLNLTRLSSAPWRWLISQTD
jgi:hypothetical protein